MFEHTQDSFPHKEETVLSFWEKEKIFEKTMLNRSKAPLFSFYDGPPFATGLPHYGHILAGTIKDVIPRYKTMKGFNVPRRFGWDCHGLPVENEIEKAKNLSGASSIESFGIANFNEECRSIVLRYTDEWKRTVNRMGRWVSFENTYRTMDLTFMESVWWVFGQLFEKGLVYEGFKVMPFSTKLGTPLSNFEANLNYKEVDDPSLTVLFSLKEDSNIRLVVWTTTPWTLPSNLAVMVRGDLEYVKVRQLETGVLYILGKKSLSKYFKDPALYEVVDTFLGVSLVGKKYVPLLPYFSKKETEGAFRVILEDSISEEDGSGLVHSAPAFGEVDFFACLREKIEPVCPVDGNGRFTTEVTDFVGMYVKDADKEIIKKLKQEGKVLLHTQLRHRYPFCWRSDTPLIYKTVRTWFIAVEKVKDKMLKVNEEIHWIPGHIQHGRFGKWLENARDWAVSRNRYWGTPIPIWKSADGEMRVISSIEQLEEKTGQKITDLHRHFIDQLTFEENGKVFQRIPEVFDCWFESGSMPYAQNHFPFENAESTMNALPADFIAEGLDQTRGWFYTLTVLSSALFDKPAFKNVIVNGILLAEDGNKMSKRLKNYPEPDAVFNKHGVDAVRLYLLGSPAVQGEDLRFSERDVERVLRQTIIPLWNSFVFLSTYAKISGWTPSKKLEASSMKTEIDRWMLSLLQKTISEVEEAMDSYEINRAIPPFVECIDQLTNWYIRRNRSRFWSEESSEYQNDAFATLYEVILTLCRVMAPFTPFITEVIYQQLRKEEDPISVHLTDFPKTDSSFREPIMEKEMAFVQAVVSGGHALRKEHKIKVRQPLGKAHMVSSNSEALEALKKMENLIAEELNVKQVIYHQEETAFVELIAKPNFRVLGKKVGGKMNAVHKMILMFSQGQLQTLFSGKPVDLDVDGEKIQLTLEDVNVERKVRDGVIAHSLEGLTVALDTTLSPELIQEGLCREIINKINLTRKELDFAITDRITVEIKGSDEVVKCFDVHGKYIAGETLIVGINFVDELIGAQCDLGTETIILSLNKVK